MRIDEMQGMVHELAVKKGWWDHVNEELTTDMILSKLALIHSEVSEAVEAVRDGKLEPWRDENGKPEGMAIELADAVIRIADLCQRLGLDLQDAIETKHDYNKGRAYRHGGRKA